MRFSFRWFLMVFFAALLAAAWNGAGISRAFAAEGSTFTASPDGRWLAVVDAAAGSLELRQPDGQLMTIFPSGSTVNTVAWSPDSRTLLVVRPNWQINQPEGTGVSSQDPIAIWWVQFEADQPQPAQKIFESPTPAGPDVAEQIQLGRWSPDSRYVFFWQGPLSASILAHGLPLAVLDVTTGQSWPVAETALLNPGYQSWSPDGAAVAVTAGPGREAQSDKWLTIWNAASGQSTTVISQTAQIPGRVAWSPPGDWLAYAAVPASLTGPEWADQTTFDNPAIAGRRIYLLDPTTGQSRRLNQSETFQDAPRWSDDGGTLYYVERQGDAIQTMAANPATGQAEAVPGTSQPLDAAMGYYGQFEWGLP